jgi:hypothetical protein
MNIQGFVPFTNLINHGARLVSQFVHPSTRKRMRQPIILTIGGGDSLTEKAMTISEARDLYKALGNALVRADYYRSLLDTGETGFLAAEDRESSDTEASGTGAGPAAGETMASQENGNVIDLAASRRVSQSQDQ